MLDRVDAGADRDLRPFGAMGMSGRLLAQPVGFVDDGVHLLLRDLRRVHLVGEGEHAAGGADLDDVGAVLDLEAYGVAELVRAARNAVLDAGLVAEEVVGEAGIVAMAAARSRGSSSG